MPYLAYFDFKLESKSPFSNIPTGSQSANFTYSNGEAQVFGELHEDWSLEVKSNFQSYAEAMGSVSSIAGSLQGIIDKLKTARGLGLGSTNIGGDYNKFLVWKDTEPINLNLTLTFETKTDPYFDVFLPVNLLLSRTMITPINDYEAKVPGFFAGLLSSKTSSNGTTTTETVKPGTGEGGPTPVKNLQTLIESVGGNGKILSSFGILFRNLADDNASVNTSLSSSTIGYGYKSLITISPSFILSVKPTYSKDRTTSGIPLYAKVEVQVQSLFSAMDSVLNTSSRASGNFNGVQFGSAVTNIFR